jgi:outer membrane protein
VATSKVKALNDKKVTELNDKNKQLQTAEAKLQKEGGVMSDAARGQLEKEIDRLQKEIQRFTQDAQAEVQELQNELQRDFQRKLLPIVGQVGADKGLHMIFSVEESGLVWADTGLDMTAEIIKRLDAAKPAAK